MINIFIDPSSKNELLAEVSRKVEGVKELNSQYVKKELMDTAFSIASLKFVKKINMMARSNKNAFHHIYEWDKTGVESGRLFRIVKRNSFPGSATVYSKFLSSKKNSPIAKSLKIPGSTGKIVTKSGIFKNKASVMEEGKSVGFITSRTIAFSSDNKIVFIPPGKKITIKNPGGKNVVGSFNKNFESWWKINFPHILDDSGVFNKIEVNVAKALSKKNAGPMTARETILSTLSRYQTTGSVI